MRAAILARVSKGHQAQAERTSLPYQREAMEVFAAARGWPIVATFEIPGESASKWYPAERPQFQAVIEAAGRGEFDVLLIYDLSRFARNQTVLHEARRTLRGHGVQLWSVSGGYDVVADGMRAGMEGLVAEQYATDHSRRLLAAFSRRHADGYHVGAVPFGYQRSAPALGIVETEAVAVRTAFAMRAVGAGYVEIATWLNANGHQPRSWNGRTWWGGSSVQAMIQSRTYLAEVTRHGQWRAGLHAAIVTGEQWEAAQAVASRRGAQPRDPWLLSGLAVCRHCGGPIWQSLSGRANGTRYYRDAAKSRRVECQSAGGIWSAHEPEQQARDIIVSLALDDAWLESVHREARRMPKGQPLEDIEQLKRQRAIEEDIYRSGGDAAQFRARVAAIDVRIRAAQPSPDALLSASERLRSIGQIWDGAETRWRREVLRTLFARVPLAVDARKLWVEPRDDAVRGLLAHRAEWVCAGASTQSQARSAHTAFSFAELVAS